VEALIAKERRKLPHEALAYHCGISSMPILVESIPLQCDLL
jgi:hypothetical protein